MTIIMTVTSIANTISPPTAGTVIITRLELTDELSLEPTSKGGRGEGGDGREGEREGGREGGRKGVKERERERGKEEGREREEGQERGVLNGSVELNYPRVMYVD